MAAHDRDKLRVLLPHWIEHNAEHAAEFRRWSQRAQADGQKDLADGIKNAADKMDAVNEALTASLGKLGEWE